MSSHKSTHKSTQIDESKFHMQLRNKAEAKLKAGAISSTRHWTLGIDALQLLHRLSSNPDTAEDALKLLHELQVHQVELDLQNEELAANEQALAEELDLYRELYDSAPLGYFLVDREGVVIQGNPAAAALFDIAQNQLTGQRIDTFLDRENRPQLHELLQRVAEVAGVAKSSARHTCIVAAGGGTNAPRRLQFLASSSSNGEYVLLACCEYPGVG